MAMKLDCGCQWVSPGTVNMCPLHSAASEMLEACQFAYVRALQTADQDSELVNTLFVAIAKATGGE